MANRERTIERTKNRANRFMDIIECKYTGKNPIKKWLSNRKFKKTCKEIMHGSPSLGVLWIFADFIKLAERNYFYDSFKDGIIFSSRSYNSGENGFIINDKSSSNVSLNVKVYSDEQKVVIEVKHLNGTRMTTLHTFINNQWIDSEEDNYDEVLIDNVIGIINSHIIALLNYCWNRKGNFDNYNQKI